MTRDADSAKFPFHVTVNEARTLSRLIAAADVAGEDEVEAGDFRLRPIQFVGCLAGAFLCGVIAAHLI